LVDDPVVAGDAIKRDLAIGHPPIIASWLGPTKLATAILYATITNIVAYLPFLMIKGNTGEFIFTLPVVITCSSRSLRCRSPNGARKVSPLAITSSACGPSIIAGK
ncbi:MAG TPA: hypothetical protein VFP64_12830, partial [Pyrinomonadaceae bacterium]|nr:hypothetical protein [Pyrinomonadaceae bacterium]